MEIDEVLQGSSLSTFEVFLAAGIPNGWKNVGEDAAATMYDAGILLEP